MGIKAAESLYSKITKGKLKNGFTARDVYRNQWHLLTKKEVVQVACDELVDAGVLQEDITEGGIGRGKGKTAYLINPKLGVDNGQVAG